MTVQDLFDIHYSHTPALAYYNRGKVKEFYKRFESRMVFATERINALTKEYAEYEGELPKMEDKKLVMKDENLREEFEEKRNKILNQII